jgi:peptide/nickel transport system substrate-binding protein
VYQYNADGQKICQDDSEKGFYQKSSIWAQQFPLHFARRVIVSCGAWLFDSYDDHMMRFTRNPDNKLPRPALFQALEWHFVPNHDAMLRDFFAQKIDVCELLPSDVVFLDQFLRSSMYDRMKVRGEIKRLDALENGFHYVGWNMINPLFSSKKTRLALSAAIDYRALMSFLKGEAVQITSPFRYGSPEYDARVVPRQYAPDEAKLLLAEEGWCDSNGDGILQKEIDGVMKPFRFQLAYLGRDPVAKIFSELLSFDFRQIGIECIPRGVELHEISQMMDDKNFEAIYLGWAHGDPPEDPTQLWESSGVKDPGSSNFVSFSNKEVDLLIKKLKFEHNLKTRVRIYHRIHDILFRENPYSFLFSYKGIYCYWSWVQNVFNPKERQDLIPGAYIEEPTFEYCWMHDQPSAFDIAM